MNLYLNIILSNKIIMIEVSENFKVYDNRNINSYKNYSFTGFNKNSLIANYTSLISANDLPKAIYIGLELLFSNQLDNLINKIIKIYSVDININNPKLVILLNHRIKDIEKIKNNSGKSDIELRNNAIIRNIIVELTSIINNSQKKSFTIPKIIDGHFNFNNIKDKIIGTDKIIVNKILKAEDPNELLLPINEFINHINITINYNKNNQEIFKNTNMSNTCHAEPFFWCAWLIEYEKRSKNKNSRVNAICASRKSELYDDKYSTEIIWILWDVINYFANRSGDDTIQRLIRNNYQLFCHKYSKGTKNDRKGLLFNCILILITPNLNVNKTIYNDRDAILRACLNTNLLSKKLMIDGKTFFESKKDELLNWGAGSIGFKKVDLSNINYEELNNIEKSLNSNNVIDFNNKKIEKKTFVNKKNILKKFEPEIVKKYNSNSNILKDYELFNKRYEKTNYSKNNKNELTNNAKKIVNLKDNEIKIPLLDGTHINLDKNLFNKKNKLIIEDDDEKNIEKSIYINNSLIPNNKKTNAFKKSLEEKKTYSNNIIEKDNILQDIRKSKVNNENEIPEKIEEVDKIEEIIDNKVEEVIEKNPILDLNIFNKLFINQSNVNDKTLSLGKVEDYIYDEKETSFSNSTHKLIFNYNDIYYPLLVKKYTSINKTFLPVIINELKDLFKIYKLSTTRFTLQEKSKKYYYLGYLRKYPDKFSKIADFEDMVICDDDLMYQLLQIIAFRWIIGTNESNYKTIIIHNIMEDNNEEIDFNLYKSNNKFNKFKLFSYEENSIGGDNKINFNAKIIKYLKNNNNILKDILENWKNNIDKNNIKNIFNKYLPKNIDIDIDLKVMYITYKLNNYNNIFNLF